MKLKGLGVCMLLEWDYEEGEERGSLLFHGPRKKLCPPQPVTWNTQPVRAACFNPGRWGGSPFSGDGKGRALVQDTSSYLLSLLGVLVSLYVVVSKDDRVLQCQNSWQPFLWGRTQESYGKKWPHWGLDSCFSISSTSCQSRQVSLPIPPPKKPDLSPRLLSGSV